MITMEHIARQTARADWQPRLGAVLADNGRCTFRVWAPAVTDVKLHLVGNRDEHIDMPLDDFGYATVTIEDVSPGQTYFYSLDGVDYPDPVSRYQPDGVFGPSAVVDRAFNWTDADWFGRPLETFVIYELHVGTFTEGGTFDAAIEPLDDLADVGITAVELLPVAQFSGTRNWGYDGVLQFAVQDSYGGPDGLKRFVDACHARGIAVILDVVYNHFGPEGNCYPCYGPYLTDHYKTPWGQAINFDGPESDEVRAFFVENVLYWFHEFHLDGLRLDATHHLYDNRAQHILQLLAETVAAHRVLTNRHFVLIAESDTNDPRILRSPLVNGIGMDAQWNDDFHHAVHALLTNETGHYYAGYDAIDSLVKALREGFIYSGQYSPYRKRSHGASSYDIPGKQFIVFTQNHDQIGNRLPSDRIARYVSFDALKVWIGLAALSPYVPMIFMGEEYAEPAPFNFFTDFHGEELIEAIRKGRMEQFALGTSDEGFPDPQDVATFTASRLDHSLKRAGKHAVMQAFHKALFALRRTQPALATLDKSQMMVIAYEDDRVVYWRRWAQHESVCAAYNLSDQAVDIALPVPAARYQLAFNSADERWSEDSTDPNAPAPDRWIDSDGTAKIALAPLSFIVLVRA